MPLDNLDGVVTGTIETTHSVGGDVSPTVNVRGNVTVPRSGISEIPPATTETIGGIIVGEDLLISSSGVLSVNKATSVSQDNTKPITSAAVFAEIGNIQVLLETI